MFINENCHFAVGTPPLVNILVTKHHISMNRSVGKGLIFFSQRSKQN
jgi:hypothetical protein